MEPKAIFEKMFKTDTYSQWLGIRCLDIQLGTCVLQMSVKKKMVNGFGIAHGGITYGFSDSALAFACNSHGDQAVSIETSISHLAPVQVGDILLATAVELSKSRRVAVYEVTVINQRKERVSHFKGTVYRTEKKWTE